MFRKPFSRQRGAASILMVLLTALGLMALTAYSLQAPAAAQKVQFTEHVATQAELKAWTGVALLSEAVKKLTTNPTLTAGQPVTLTGTQSGISITYVGPGASISGNPVRIFQVQGSSAGATSTLQVAVLPGPTSGNGGGGNSGGYGAGQLLHGPTVFSGDVNYTGTDNTPANITVIGGTLQMNGSVSGLKTVCATGDINMSSAISVETLCSNGSITLGGSANAQNINATGNVTLSGGAASTVGNILSNGAVTLSGGSADAGTVTATGNVIVSGGSAKADNIFTQGNVMWTQSSAVASAINANGTVAYKGAGTTSSTVITAIGDVSVGMADKVYTQGNVALTGYYDQGVKTLLQAQKQLSWNSSGNIVGAGTVYSVAATKPAGIHVTVTSPTANAVSISPVTVPTVATITAPSPTVNAYALQDQANLIFNGVDASGNPMVTVKNINGVTDGHYFIAANGSKDWLCTGVSGTTCVGPITRICQGNSSSNTCFSRNFSNGETNWRIEGKTALPLVMWFEGNLEVSTGNWVNTFLASGDILTSGNMKMFSPNYPAGTYTCQGLATTVEGVSLPALGANSLTAGYYPKQLCSGSPALPIPASIGNLSVLAGGFVNDVFSGGNITLGASSHVYGIILAGQYFKSSGSTTVAGFIFAGKQGAEAGQNQEGSSTTVKLNGGSSAYNPGGVPCMANCNNAGTNLANNVVWASPI